MALEAGATGCGNDGVAGTGGFTFAELYEVAQAGNLEGNGGQGGNRRQERQHGNAHRHAEPDHGGQ